MTHKTQVGMLGQINFWSYDSKETGFELLTCIFVRSEKRETMMQFLFRGFLFHCNHNLMEFAKKSQRNETSIFIMFDA